MTAAIDSAFASARQTIARLELERDARDAARRDELGTFALIVDVLDAAADLSGYKLVTLFADRYPDSIAEYAFVVWAGSRNLPVVEHISHWEGRSIRVLEIQLGPHGTDGVIGLQWGPR